MRTLLPLLLLVVLAGCASPAPAPAAETPATQSHDAAAPSDLESLSFTGQYQAVKPLGEAVRESGSTTTLGVAGWSDVVVTLDSTIEIDLVLLPPGCTSADQACALRFSPPEDEVDGTWAVGSMEPGDWTVVVQADADDYSFVDGKYAVAFDYLSL